MSPAPVRGVPLTDLSVAFRRCALEAFSESFMPNSSRLGTCCMENLGPGVSCPDEIINGVPSTVPHVIMGVPILEGAGEGVESTSLYPRYLSSCCSERIDWPSSSTPDNRCQGSIPPSFNPPPPFDAKSASVIPFFSLDSSGIWIFRYSIFLGPAREDFSSNVDSPVPSGKYISAFLALYSSRAGSVAGPSKSCFWLSHLYFSRRWAFVFAKISVNDALSSLYVSFRKRHTECQRATTYRNTYLV